MLRNVSHPTVLSIVAMEMFLLMTNADAQPNRPMNTVPVLRYEPPASFMRSAVYPPEDYLSTHCCKAGSTRGIGKRVWQADRNLGRRRSAERRLYSMRPLPKTEWVLRGRTCGY